jgi:hypothetical protein
MMSLWPQALVALLLIGIVFASIAKHGETMTTPINCTTVLWNMFVLAAVLGAGGFWRLP